MFVTLFEIHTVNQNKSATHKVKLSLPENGPHFQQWWSTKTMFITTFSVQSLSFYAHIFRVCFYNHFRKAIWKWVVCFLSVFFIIGFLCKKLWKVKWNWKLFSVSFLGQAIPMPPELMELYNLYKQELETRTTRENQFVEDLNNEIIRVCNKN